MFRYSLLLFTISTLVFSFPGSFQVSFTRSEIVSDSLPLLVDHYQMITIGSNINIYPQFNLMVETGYGSPSRSADVSAPDSLVSDIESRIYLIKAGVDYQLHKEAPFFLRGAAGSVYMERDYTLSTSPYVLRKYSDGEWESIVSVGLGSKLPLDFIPLITNAEFLLSAEWIGSEAMVITAGIGLGI